jgi:hypothetical protein
VDWAASAGSHTKNSKKPLFVSFFMEDYKSLAAIAALPQWPVHLCLELIHRNQQKISMFRIYYVNSESFAL